MVLSRLEEAKYTDGLAIEQTDQAVDELIGATMPGQPRELVTHAGFPRTFEEVKKLLREGLELLTEHERKRHDLIAHIDPRHTWGERAI